MHLRPVQRVLITCIFALVASWGFAAPVITNIAPSTVRPGAVVTLTGSGFTGATGTPLRFNGSSDGTGGKAAAVGVVDDTSLTVTVPLGAVSGRVSLTVGGVTGLSSGTLTIAPDLQLRNPALTADTLRGIALGDDGAGHAVYVAIGSAGDIITSTPDIDHWSLAYTSRTTVAANSFYAVTFTSSPHLFVAVGNNGVIMTSPDGTTWTQRAAGTANYRGVAFGNGTFVAVATGTTTVATSADGVTWATNTSGVTSTASLAFGNGTFVTAGTGGAIRTSTNGTAWVTQTSNTANQLNGVAWCNDRFIAVGNNSTLVSSPDGVNWTVQGTPNSTTTLFSAIYGNGIYLVTSTAFSFYSTNGTSWTAASNTNFEGRALVFDGAKIVAAGAAGEIATSLDGVNWTLRNTTTRLNFTDVVYGAGRYVAISSSANSTFATSTDGLAWTTAQVVRNTNLAFNDIAAGYGNFVAVGNGVLYTAGAYDMTQNLQDAQWENNVPGGAPNLQAVAFGNGVFVTVGNAGVAFRSGDNDDVGYQWAPVTSGTTSNLLGIGHGSASSFTGFVTVGAAGVLLTSPDGTTWTTRTSGTTNQLNGVAFNGTRCVVVGANSTVLTSTDGVTWITQTLGTSSINLTDVAYGDGCFVATNLTTPNVLFVSTDGVTWAQADLTLHSLNQSTVAGIGYGNGRFIVVSAGGLILSSNPAADTLAITTQPASQSFTSGNTVTFNVTASGTGLHYQWYQEPIQDHLFSTVNPVGTDSASYTTPVLTLSQAYWVRVTDASGATVESSTAVAYGPPRITDSPETETVTAGNTVQFGAYAVGSGTMTYQWQKNGVDIAGATGSTLVLANVQAADAGSYTVVASNGNGSAATSIAGVLTVTPQVPVFAASLLGTKLVAEGQSFQLTNGYTVVSINNVNTSVPLVTGSEPITYQWKKNGVVVTDGGTISGATTPALTFTNAQAADAGDYVLYASNSTGPAAGNSGAVTLNVAGGTRPYAFTTLAGLSNKGGTDATGTAARFANPQGVALSGTSLYVADTANHVIRVVNVTTGQVTTLAGLAGYVGTADGTGAAARFNNPGAVAVDGAGNVYVDDNFNATIRKITPAGVVTTLAGSPGLFGATDGTGSAARFNRMTAMVLDGSGYLYVTDASYGTIRKINTATGAATTFAGLAGQRFNVDGTGTQARFNTPAGITRDSVSGDLYITDSGLNVVRKITPAGVVTTLAGAQGVPGSADGTGGVARFRGAFAIAADSTGNLYVADSGNHTIRKVTSAGVVTTLAGTAGSAGAVDGTGAVARFNNPSGIVADGSGNLYVAEQNNSIIRKVTPAGVVTTVAGVAPPSGSFDGTGTGASFGAANDVAVDSAGNAYVADAANHTIRKITPAGVTTTLAGLTGVSGTANGVGTAARFNGPSGIALDNLGNLIVADTGNHAIRRVAPDGTVTTVAGLPGTVGNTPLAGTVASTSTVRFSSPRGVTVDGNGNIFVADTTNNVIRRIAPDNAVINWAGTAGTSGFIDVAAGQALTARFSNPWKVAVDDNGGLWVADRSNSRLRRVGADGSVSTALILPAIVLGVAVDHTGGVYVSTVGSVWKYHPVSGGVDLLGGGVAAGATGSVDGTGTVARWFQTDGLAVSAAGRVYVADSVGNTIRTGLSVPALTFPTITAKHYGDMPFNPGATTSSGLGVRYTVVSGPASVQEGSIALIGTGSVTVRAYQEGNDTYYLEQTFTVGAPVVSPAIVGTWTKFSGATDGSSVTIFLSDGYYFQIQDASAAQVATGGADGLEVGTYTWNPGSGAFTVTTIFDNNGNVGLSGLSGMAGLTVNIAGDSFTLNIPGQGSDVSTRVGGTNPLVGSWTFSDPGVPDHRAVVTFLPNGYYFFAQDGDSSPYTGDPHGQDGMERGTYAWDTVTGGFTATAIADSNGQWGFSDPFGVTTVTMFADLITMHVVNPSDGTDVYLNRIDNVVAPAVSVQPVSQTVPVSFPVTFTATVGGTPLPTYQWQKNGVNISGATASSYTIANVASGDAGTYRVIATNAVGSATSSSATLTVIPKPTADFNADGKADLILQNTSTGERKVWLMNGTTKSSEVSVVTNTTDWQIAGIGDFNADGKSDLLWQNTTTGERRIWLMNGTVKSSEVSIGFTSTDWQFVSTGDFNADGQADILWQNIVTGERYVWLMNGTSLLSGVSLGTVATQWLFAGTGDFNGDGKSDIVLQNTVTGERYLWLMNGTVFDSGVSLGTASTAMRIAMIGDYNGDGKPDLVWQNLITGERSVWLMNGATKTGEVSLGTVGLEWTIGRPAVSSLYADFNSDLKSDILLQNTSTGERVAWLMNGTTKASEVSLGFLITDWQIAGTGDFNADGKSDIVLQNVVTGERYAWLMNGTVLGNGVSFGFTNLDWQIAGTGDFNGDGTADILWQNTVTGDRYLWHMSGTVLGGGVSLGTLSTDWQFAGVGDFNADGQADILLQNTVTGQRYVWLMNDATLLNGVSLGIVTTDWQIVGAGDYNADGKADILWQNTTTGERKIWLMNGTTKASEVSLGITSTAWQIVN